MVMVRASLLIPGTGRKPSMCVCVLVSGGLRHGEVGGPPGAPNPSTWPLSWLQLSRPKQMGICAVSQNPQQIFVRSHRSTALEPRCPKTQAQEALLTHRGSSCFTMTPPPLAGLLAGWVRPCAQSPDAQGESLGEHVYVISGGREEEKEGERLCWWVAGECVHVCVQGRWSRESGWISGLHACESPALQSLDWRSEGTSPRLWEGNRSPGRRALYPRPRQTRRGWTLLH